VKVLFDSIYFFCLIDRNFFVGSKISFCYYSAVKERDA
jgi:hypothetical protein